MGDFVFTSFPMGVGKLILSDGQRTLDLVGSPPVGIYLAEFSPPIVADENTFASSPDMEGGIRTRTKPENPTGSGRIWVNQVAGTAVSFWSDIENLQDLFRSAHRNKGTIAYTPPGGSEVTFDLEAIRITEMTHDHGLVKRRMNLAFEFVCKPYARLPEATIFTAQTFDWPIDSVDIPATVDGHVDALGKLVFVEPNGQVRDDVEWGIDENTAASIRTTAANLVVTGYAGVFDTDHVEVTVLPNWVAVCATPALTHVGRYRVKARCTCPSTDTQVRLVWHSGDAPYIENLPAIPHLMSSEIELDLGVVNIVEQEGTHAWSGRVEVIGDTAGNFEITDLFYIPADRYGRARGPLSLRTPSVFAARDPFDQTAGALTGKVAAQGGTYVVLAGSDADDFAVNATDHTAERSSVSDSGTLAGGFLPGRAVGLDLNMTDVAASIDFTIPSNGVFEGGFFLRVVDASNFLFVKCLTTGVQLETVAGGSATGQGNSAGLALESGVTYTLVAVLVDDSYYVLVGRATAASLPVVMSGAVPGGITTGDVYLYDENSTATAATRVYDNLDVWVPELSHVVNPLQSMQINHRSAQRENEAGTRWGDVPVYTGRRLLIPPATRNGDTSRLIVKQDRNDLVTQAVRGASADDLTATLTVEPRVLLTS